MSESRSSSDLTDGIFAGPSAELSQEDKRLSIISPFSTREIQFSPSYTVKQITPFDVTEPSYRNSALCDAAIAAFDY